MVSEYTASLGTDNVVIVALGDRTEADREQAGL